MSVKRWLLGFGLLVVTGMLSACQPKAQSASSHLTVVASVDFYGEVAEAVGGKNARVTAIIHNPNLDPHDYEPTTKDGKAVAKAQVLVVNGAGYDSWLNRLAKASPDARVVSAARVLGIKDGENEHIWYKPTAMPKLAEALAKEFGRVDPKHKATYDKNATAYIKSLDTLTGLIDSLKPKAKGQKVAVSEPVFNNALVALGYTVSNPRFAKAIENGNDPSPKDLRELKAAIKNKEIAFFVQNKQVHSRLIDDLVQDCKEAGVPVLKVTETLPTKQTYTSWMTSQYRALKQIQDRE